MRVDIVIPAYNEAAIIETSLREIETTLNNVPFRYQLIVADNGSTDGTAERARGVSGVMVLSIPIKGKGAALTEAARQSGAEYFAFLDADLSAHPRELIRLYEVMQKEHVDLVIGSRLLEREQVQRSYLRTLSSTIFNVIRRILLGIHVTDTQCGIKLCNARAREVLASCKETGWFLDIELLARAEREGLRIREVPVAWEEFRFPDRPSKLHIIRDGIAGVIAMIRIRLYL